eukprot:symbB.v1.2.038738.t1/scaffold6151.1/size20538/1
MAETNDERFFPIIEDLNVPLQLHQITRFLSTFGRAKQWQSALRLMEVVQTKRLEPNIY